MKPLFDISEDELSKLGIVDWGYTEDPIPTSMSNYEQWVNRGDHGPLKYLADQRKFQRGDIRRVEDDFQSALVFLVSYAPTKKWMLENNQHSVAAYTVGYEGKDYHRAVKNRTLAIGAKLADKFPGLRVVNCLDLLPVLERDLAYRAGLGWFGKNSMLISQKEGSYFLIASILLNQKLPLETRPKDIDHCGTCNACVEACPTQVIDPETRTIRAKDCISTFTIEITKPAEPPVGFDKSRGEIFGCDICQDVCPWNAKPLSKVTGELKLSEQFSFLKTWFFEWPREKLKVHLEALPARALLRAFDATVFARPEKPGWLKNFKR